MNSKKNVLLGIVCITCITQVILGHIVGSSTVSSRQLRTFFGEKDILNKMYGFSVFENGLSLENENASCMFDAFFPISGGINLNGGTLYLAKDAEFKYPLALSPGTINGEGNSLRFPSNVSSISLPMTNHNKLFSLCDTKNVGDNVNDISWSFDDTYIATVCDSFGGDELQIYFFDAVDQTLSLTASYNFENRTVYSVKWHPAEYYLAVGKYGDSELYTFYFDSNTAELEVIDSANVGTVYDVDWSPDGQLLAVGQGGKKELLVYKVNDGVLDTCYTCTLHTANVAVPKHGLAWSSDGQCLATSFKVNNSTYRLKTFRLHDDYFSDGTYIETSDRMGAISWKKDSPYIAAGFTSSSERLRIYEHDSVTHELSEVLFARSGEKRHIYEVKWNGDYLVYLKDQSNITYELKVCYFDTTEQIFSIVAGANCGKDLKALACSSSGDYTVVGGTGGSLMMFSFDFAPLIFKDVKLFFDSDVVVDGDVIFQGSCIVDCGRNSLEFADEGKIIVANGGSLLLSDVVIRGVSGNKVTCEDNTGIIKLKDVTWIQGENFTFSTGALQFENDIFMTGDYIFAYQSIKTSTLLSQSTLELDVGFTFSYNPVGSDAKDLLALEDSSAMLLLNGATLHTTGYGMELTKGKLRVLRDSFLSSEKTVELDEFGDEFFTHQGITLGNSNSSEDIVCDIFSGVTLHVLPDSLVNYKNVLSSSWSMCNFTSLLCMNERTRLNLYENLHLGNGALLSMNNAIIGKALGKDITGSLRPQGLLLYTNI